MPGADGKKAAEEVLTNSNFSIEEAVVRAYGLGESALYLAADASKNASWGKVGGFMGGLGSLALLGKSMFIDRPAMQKLAQNLEAQATKTNIMFGGLVAVLVAAALPLLKSQPRNIAPRLSQARVHPQKHPQQILPALTPPQQSQALHTYPALSSSILKI